MSSIQAYALRNDPAPQTPPAAAAMHPVHITAFTDLELDEDSFATALEKTGDAGNDDAMPNQISPTLPSDDIKAEASRNPVDSHVFDHAMLDGLKGAMKPEELKDMIDSPDGQER